MSSYFAGFYETVLKLVVGGLLFWGEGCYFDLSEIQGFLAISANILYYEIMRFQFIVEKKFL